MKKLVALLVALMMLGSVPAMAEMPELDLSGLEPIDTTSFESPFAQVMNSMAMNGADTAIISDELCTIYSGDLKITFDLTQSAFNYVTQDYSASEAVYKECFTNPKFQNEYYIQNKIHLDIYDMLYHDSITLRTFADLGISGAEGTLANYDAVSQIQLAEMLASKMGGEVNGYVDINDTLWVITDQDWCFNLTNGKILLLNAVHMDHMDNSVKLEPEAQKEILQFFSITSRY